MTWSYRIVRYRDGGFGLHEVFYDDEGLAFGMTEGAVGFTCGDDEEPMQAIADALTTAMSDAKLRPIFDEPPPDQWPGRPPGGDDGEAV